MQEDLQRNALEFINTSGREDQRYALYGHETTRDYKHKWREKIQEKSK